MSTAATTAPVPRTARGMSRAAVRELARPRSAADRLRRRTTAAASCGAGVALLIAAAVVALPDTGGVRVGNGSIDPEGNWVPSTGVVVRGGLAPFLAEEGLRPGAVLAAVLLVLPFTALAVQALRVGSAEAARRARALALAGATPADLRRLRTASTVGSFVRGGVLAAPAYLLLWTLGLALPPGARLVPVPTWHLLPAWGGVLGLLALVGALVAATDGTGRRTDPLDARLRPQQPPPLALAGVSTVAALAVFALVSSRRVAEGVFLVALLVALLLLVVTVTVVWAHVAARARPSPRASDAAVAVLAAAQRRAAPRSTGLVAGVLFVCGLSFGVEASLAAGFLDDDHALADLTFYVGGALLAGAVGALAVAVALLALLLALTDHLLAARRAVASTAALGTEPHRLLAVQARALSATAVPATAAGTAVGSYLYPPLLLVESAWAWALPLLVTAAATAVVAVAVAVTCRVLARLLRRRVVSASALENLRTP